MLTCTRAAASDDARRARGDRRPLATAAADRVTVLTSLSDADLAQIGFTGSSRRTSCGLARPRARVRPRRVVCSRRKPPRSARRPGSDFSLVTPGIRVRGGDKGDQSRVGHRRSTRCVSARTIS
jgi:orotidine-5'-phosphate decarboxylase